MNLSLTKEQINEIFNKEARERQKKYINANPEKVKESFNKWKSTKTKEEILEYQRMRYKIRKEKAKQPDITKEKVKEREVKGENVL